MKGKLNGLKQDVNVKARPNGWIRDIKKNYNLYLMALPPILLVIIFCYLPMYGIVIAFKDYDIVMGYGDSQWVGLKHFISFFKDPYCFRLISNTLLIGFYNLIWSFWPPILLAILLNEVKCTKFQKAVQSISYMPHFIATVILVGMMVELFGTTGIVNDLVVSLGFERINFFNESKYFRTLYIGSGIWQGMGYGSIIYLAALSGIDQEMFEASYIDGANRFQRIWYISIPSITPIITILLILSAANIINVGFEKVYLMQNPAIYDKSDIISTYVYRRGIINRDFSFSTAVGLLNSVVSFLILYVTNYAVKMMDGETLW